MDEVVKIVGISQLTERGRTYDCCIDDFENNSDEEIKAPDLHSHEENITLDPKSQKTRTSINKFYSVLSSEPL